MAERSTKEQALLAAYMFHGDDELKRSTLLRRLADRIAATGDLMLNQQVFSPDDLKEPYQLLDALNILPFGGGLRLVVVKDADHLGKELSEAVVSYLQQPTETTVLVLLAEKLAKNTRLYKAFAAYNKQSIIDTASVRRYELPGMLRQMAANYGINLDYEAAESLIERVGTSTLALGNEMGRLAAWAAAAGRRDIGLGDIIDQVPAVIEPKPWELADALCQRDTALTLRLYGDMASAQPTAIFLHCVSRLREVLSVQSLRRRGYNSGSQIAQALGKQEWLIRSSVQAAGRFSEEELTRLIKQAQRVEKELKSGADTDHVLTLWLLEVCLGVSAADWG